MALRPVPIVGFVGATIVGGTGVAAFTAAGRQIAGAVTQIRDDRARYDGRYDAHLTKVDETNAELSTFGRTQERAQRAVTYRMQAFLKRHSKQVRVREYPILDGVEAPTVRVVGMAKLNLDVVGWLQGVVDAARAGATTAEVIHKAVTHMAKASTGKPISELYGAAQKYAEDAVLGGGSLASGGGGRKLGAKVRVAVVAGPVVLAASLAAIKQATQVRTEADNYRTNVDTAIKELDVYNQLLRGVCERAQELDAILTWLMAQATDALDLLESDEFDNDVHGARLQAAWLLVMSVGEVLRASVADEHCTLDMNTEKLVFKYSNARRETPDA